MVYDFRLRKLDTTEREDMYPSLLDVVLKKCRPFALTAIEVGVDPKQLRLQALRSCSKEPEALQTIIDYLNITSEDARAVFNDMPLPSLKRLAEKFVISKDAAVQAFISACRRGDVDMARWLAGEFQLDVLAEWAPEALRGALSCGKLELVKWLIESYKLDPDSASDVFEVEKLLSVIENPAVLEYMISSYAINREEGFAAFEFACRDGNLACAKVLEKVFRFNPNAVRKGNRLLRECAAYGYITKWLLDTYYKDSSN